MKQRLPMTSHAPLRPPKPWPGMWWCTPCRRWVSHLVHVRMSNRMEHPGAALDQAEKETSC